VPVFMYYKPDRTAELPRNPAGTPPDGNMWPAFCPYLAAACVVALRFCQ
jgi:hypothetical protein